MVHERSNHLGDVVDAISKIKNAEKDWPAGFINPLLREVILRTERELQEELFAIMSKKKVKRAGAARKVIQHKEGDRS